MQFYCEILNNKLLSDFQLIYIYFFVVVSFRWQVKPIIFFFKPILVDELVLSMGVIVFQSAVASALLNVAFRTLQDSSLVSRLCVLPLPAAPPFLHSPQSGVARKCSTINHEPKPYWQTWPLNRFIPQQQQQINHTQKCSPYPTLRPWMYLANTYIHI